MKAYIALFLVASCFIRAQNLNARAIESAPVMDTDQCSYDLREVQTAYHIALNRAEQAESSLEILRYENERMQGKLDSNAALHTVLMIAAGVMVVFLVLAVIFRASVRATRHLFGGISEYIAARAGYVREPRLIPMRDVHTDDSSSPGPSLVLEANVEGSLYRKTEKIPKCQFEVQYDSSSGITTAGQGVRIGDYLLTAGHVITKLLAAEVETVYIVTSSGRVPTHIGSWTTLVKVDAAYMGFIQSAHQCLALSKASLIDNKYASYTSLPVRVHTMANFTDGSISDRRNGTVWYHGSTKAGFSGAPYMWGEKVVAMHQGSYNIGYGQDYHLLMSFLPTHTLEANMGEGTGGRIYEEIIEDFFRKGTRPDYYLTPGEIRIKKGNQYYTVDIDEMPDKLNDIIQYCEGHQDRPRVLESNVLVSDELEDIAQKQSIEDYNRIQSEKLDLVMDKIVLNNQKLSDHIIVTKMDTDEKLTDLANGLHSLTVRHIDVPANGVDVSKNCQSPPDVEANGRSDRAINVQSFELMQRQLQSLTSRLENMASMIGRTSTPAQQKRASRNT
uniref:Serine protease n=1 Tax=Riboviria sp. TaxID=2585031 RepID=A0A8K1U2U8_9VIRU|nr:MAG: hypothetical protein 2 [Riboviria sp.]